MDNHTFLRKIRGFRLCTVHKFIVLTVLVITWLFTADFLFHSYERLKQTRNPSTLQWTASQLTSALHEVTLIKQQHEAISKILMNNIKEKNPMTEEEKYSLLQQRWENFKQVKNMLQSSNIPVFEVRNKNPIEDDGPAKIYEQARRRVESGITEMWFFFGAQLKQLKNLTLVEPELTANIDRIIDEGIIHKRNMLNTSHNLLIDDGYKSWREREAKELSDLVQQRLYSLQHPQDCSSARKLVCQVNKFCGFACQINHIFYCLVEALGMQRTMVLDSEVWTDYVPRKWNDIFMPITNCSRTGRVALWPGTDKDPELLMGFVSEIPPPKPRYLPLGIPRELTPRLERLHGDPPAWWVGQFMKYLMRPQQILTKLIEESQLKLKFQKPIVGVHIRRSDKLVEEASLHPVEEYMREVEEYYSQLELSQKVEKRRVFIATDEPRVFQEAKIKYPDYEIIGDPQEASMSEILRVNNVSSILTDIYFLAHSDFIVCTFSSGVCRLAYEIMQTLHPDASLKYRSLDDIYFSSGQINSRQRKAVYEHHAGQPEEIDLKIGDIITVAGNHWDGYSLGTNNRTGKKGLYPSHKVMEQLESIDFLTNKNSFK